MPAIVSFFRNKKLFFASFILFIFLWASFFITTIFFQKNSKQPTTKQFVFQKEQSSKYYDAIFSSFELASNTLTIQITKDGLVTSLSTKPDSGVAIKKIVYKNQTKELVSEKKINWTDLKFGDPLRLRVANSDTNFNLKGLSEVDLYVPEQ